MRALGVALLLTAAICDADDRPLQSVRIRSADVQQRVRDARMEGMGIRVVVETVGFGGRDIGVQVWLTDPDERPIRASRGTPKRYRDPRGAVRVTATKRAARDTACQTPIALFIPYRAIVPPGERERRIGVWITTRCGGLTGMTVLAGYLPPLQTPKDLFRMRIESVKVQAIKTGISIAFSVDSGALRKGTLEAGVRMRTPDGGAVRTRAGAPAKLTGPDGILDCRGTWTVRSAGARAVPVQLVVPYSAVELEPDREHKLALTSFARIGGWRAVHEQEIRIRIGARSGPEVIPPNDPVPALKLIHPSPEELTSPYRGGSGRFGMDSNLLRFEASVSGVKEGVHCIRVDLGDAGARFLWTTIEKGAPVEAALPVPCGLFEARFSLAGQEVTVKGEMALHAWAPSQDELAEWRRALDEWRKRNADDADANEFVISTLTQIAEGYVLRGEYEHAARACDECLALRPQTEQRGELDRIRAALFLLRGNLPQLDALYEARTKDSDAPAALYREWSERRALLDADPTRSRELWHKAEGLEPGIAAAPAWLHAESNKR